MAFLEFMVAWLKKICSDHGQGLLQSRGGAGSVRLDPWNRSSPLSSSKLMLSWIFSWRRMEKLRDWRTPPEMLSTHPSVSNGLMKNPRGHSIDIFREPEPTETY